MSDAIDTMGDYLEKAGHKYIRRTGTPGHYQYEYQQTKPVRADPGVSYGPQIDAQLKAKEDKSKQLAAAAKAATEHANKVQTPAAHKAAAKAHRAARGKTFLDHLDEDTFAHKPNISPAMKEARVHHSQGHGHHDRQASHHDAQARKLTTPEMRETAKEMRFLSEAASDERDSHQQSLERQIKQGTGGDTKKMRKLEAKLQALHAFNWARRHEGILDSAKAASRATELLHGKATTPRDAAAKIIIDEAALGLAELGSMKPPPGSGQSGDFAQGYMGYMRAIASGDPAKRSQTFVSRYPAGAQYAKQMIEYRLKGAGKEKREARAEAKPKEQKSTQAILADMVGWGALAGADLTPQQAKTLQDQGYIKPGKDPGDWLLTDEGRRVAKQAKAEKSLDAIEQLAERLEKADQIPGGLADKRKPMEFDLKQLAMGIKVEMEHTNDKKKAKEIAMDHLTEDAAYYTHLAEMEDKHAGGGDKEAKKAMPSASADITPQKARQILHDGEVHGKPLTEQQRKFFGAIGGHLPAPGAKKSMTGLEALEAFAKGHGATVGETVTSSAQKNLGDASSLPGDNAAGAGGLPHGDGDGGSLGTGTTGRPLAPNTSGGSPGGKLSEDDEEVERQMADQPAWDAQRRGSQVMMGKYRKSVIDGVGEYGGRMSPGVQAEAQAHEHAAAVSQLQKSDDIAVGYGVDRQREEGVQVFEKATHTRYGDMIHMSNVSDLEVERFQKADYQGGVPALDFGGLLRKSKPCPSGADHVMPAHLSKCDVCGAGEQLGAIGPGVSMQKSGRGLVRPYEPDLDLSKGFVIPDDEE